MAKKKADGVPYIAPGPSDRLRSLVERIERLEEEKKALASDIKDIYAEAKSAGYDIKVMRRLIAERRREPAEIEEVEQVLAVYKHALGMLADLPLGHAALDAFARLNENDVSAAVKKFKDFITKDGGSATISAAGREVVIA